MKANECTVKFCSYRVYELEFMILVQTYTKYSTLPRGLSVYIEPKVGIFSEAEGRGKYSLLRVQYMPIFHKEGF